MCEKSKEIHDTIQKQELVCAKRENTCKQLPNCGLLFFENHGSIEDKFPVGTFGTVKNKTRQYGSIAKICFLDTQFLENEYLSASFPTDPYSSFMRYLQRILYLTTQFFCIEKKT